MSLVNMTQSRHSFNAFKFKVTNKTDPDLLLLKAQIKDHNTIIRKLARNYGTLSDHHKLYRVSLMGRGTRRDASGKLLHSNADSNLQHKYAVAFDVYIHEDNHNLEILKTEIETGVSSADQARIKKLEFALMKQEWAYDDELRARGIRYDHVINEHGRRVKQYMSAEKYAQKMRIKHPDMPEHTFTRLFGTTE